MPAAWSQPWLQHALALLLAVGVPAWDRFETRRVKGAADPRAKVASYRRVVAVLWALTAVAVVAAPFSSLLYPPPVGGAAARLVAVPGEFLLGLLVAALAGLAIPVVAARLSPRARALAVKPFESFGWYLPATPAERRWFAAVAVTAGVCEEVLYRGFLIRYLTELPLGLGATGAVLVAALVFGLAHTYQGVKGMAATAVAALVFTALFAFSGALWLPMLVHALVDLRVLLLWPGRPAPAEAHA